MPAVIAPGWSLGGDIPGVYLLVAIAVLAAVGALSHEHGRPFSASIVYLALGAAAAVVLPAVGIGKLDPVRDHVVFEGAGDLAVATAVFGAGLRLPRAPARRWRRVALLLGFPLPATSALVALFGATAMGLPVAAAIVLGAALGPTDPVLAGDVGVGPPMAGEDEQEEGRFAISAEAGANDGLGAPLLVIGLFAAQEGGAGWLGRWALVDLLYGVGVATVIGAAGGYGVAAAFLWLRDRELLGPGFEGWAAVAAALGLYAVGELAGGYGFVAAFAGGIAFRRYEYGHEANRAVHEGIVTVEKFLELAVILLIGSSLTLDGLAEPGVAGWLLIPLLLVVIRPALVLLALVRSGMAARDRVYVAWFGVKGVASVDYAATALAAGVLAAGPAARMTWTVIAAVVVSILVHGITATPVGGRLLRQRA